MMVKVLVALLVMWWENVLLEMVLVALLAALSVALLVEATYEEMKVECLASLDLLFHS